MSDREKIIYCSPVYMPDGSPVPELLTEEEVIKFLRLDIDGPANPSSTLKYYRDEGLLRATRVGKKNRYMKTELLRFLDLLTRKFQSEAQRIGLLQKTSVGVR